jgi:YD repeat-containing protein
MLTGKSRYAFTYDAITSEATLGIITDAAGHEVFLLRDDSNQVKSIETTRGQSCRLQMSPMKMLHEFTTPDNYKVTFDYLGQTGLLKTKLDSTGHSYVYNYDEFGRLTSAITPTEKDISISSDLSVTEAEG